MEALYDDAPCLYFSVTDEGVLVRVNETLCRHLHYKKEELTGQKADLIFTLPTRIFQQTHFFPLLNMQGHADEIYMTLQTKEKEPLPVLVSANRKTVQGKSLSTYAGIVVHNRKKFEDELVAAKKAAEKALHENTALLQAKNELQQNAELLDQQVYLVSKQNEELRQFNHVVTHELQEPLRKLSMFTNMLLENEDTINTKNVQKIKSVSEQMRSILSGLQQYIWLIETPVTSVLLDVNSLITDVFRQVKSEHPDLALHLEKEDLPFLTGDTEQIRFLFHEIFSNAVRFRKEGNNVTLRVCGSELQLNKFRNVAGKYQFASFLKMQVQDNGLGFDATYKEQAFGLFKRLHSVSGKGVGLSLCKKIAENHLGSLQLDSQPGKGTTVTILLPLPAHPPVTAAAQNEEKQQIQTGHDE